MALLKLAAEQMSNLRNKAEKIQKASGRRAANRILEKALVRASVEMDDDKMDVDGDDNDEPPANPASGEEDADANEEFPLLTEFPWWKMKVKADNFEELIIAYLFSIGRVMDIPNLPTVLEHLTGKKIAVEQNSKSPLYGRCHVADGSNWREPGAAYDVQYSSLLIPDKLAFLRLLIIEGVLGSKLVRKYAEACTDKSLEFRKERRELEQQRKEM